MSNTIEHVEISVERLKELESIEAKIPSMIDEALKEYKQAALKRLHEKDKANPDAVNLRARRYAQKNREMLNAKRRERRRIEKEAKEAAIKKSGIEDRSREAVNITLSQPSVIIHDTISCIDSADGKIVSFN